MNHETTIIYSGEKDEVFRPNFEYFGFCYVRIENSPENMEIVAEVVHTDLKTIGEFWCSDEILNKIHRATINSTLTNFHGIPEDCPHREQN